MAKVVWVYILPRKKSEREIDIITARALRSRSLAGIVVKKMHRCMVELAEFHSGQTLQAQPVPAAKAQILQCSDIVTSGGTYALRRQMNTARREERPSLL